MQLTFSSALSVTSLTCSTTANSYTVGVSSSANLNVGQSISGTGIPANSFISTIASATSITISNVATATSGSVALSFGSRVFVVYLGKQLLTPSTDQRHNSFGRAFQWRCIFLLTLTYTTKSVKYSCICSWCISERFRKCIYTLRFHNQLWVCNSKWNGCCNSTLCCNGEQLCTNCSRCKYHKCKTESGLQ